MQHGQPGAHASVARALLSIASFVMAISLAESAFGKETVLYSFRGAPDGEQPWGPLIADRHHNLFGTTNLGGTGSCSNGSGCGTVFELSPQGNGVWAESVLYSFQGGNDGQNPPAALLLDARGNLYGVTTQGGTGNCNNMNLVGCGTVFELSPQGNAVWTESVLYSFQGVPGGKGDGDAAEPNSLVFNSSGNLIGFASDGGSCVAQNVTAECAGAAFELREKGGVWREKVLYRADSSTLLSSAALFDTRGNLYCVAAFGGPENVGEVFMLSPPSGRGAWTASTIYAFQNQSDGALPVPGLLFDAQGNLYGASSGSDSVPGNVFELTPGGSGTWTESVVFSFEGEGDVYPPQGPIMDSQGNLFGTTGIGGPAGEGSVYKASQNNGAWTERVLHSFAGGGDGSLPLSGPVIGKGGALYGTTSSGGAGNCSGGCGTVYRVTR